MRRALLFFLFLGISVCSLRAQLTPRARRLYNNAQRLQAAHQPAKAQQALRNAIKESPGYVEAYSLLGRWLFEAHQFKAASEVFLQGEKACKDGHKAFAKATAKSLFYNGDYGRAQSYIPAGAADDEWKRLAAQIAFAKTQVKKSGDTIRIVQPVGMPMRINTGVPELFPFRSADGESFYFTRRVKGIDEDFYVAKRDSCGGWFAAKNMGSPPNSSAQESAQMISADRHYLFFTRCDNRTLNGWDLGGCDLYMAYTADSVWSVPLSFGATINTPGYEGMPCLSSDNRELFFVSDRPGGYGGLDLWSSRFEHGLWQLPRNLGAAINTAGNETAPFIYADNRTLFFASTGHPGMGGSDLFSAQRIDDSTWAHVANLGTPLNTPYDEVSMSLNAAGDTAYFSSDRDSAAGNFDIYEAPLPATLKPGAVSYYKGEVHDSIAQSPLNYANIYFTDSASGKELYQIVSNRGDGSYTVALPVGHTYALMISRIGYQQAFDTIRCYTAEVKTPLWHAYSLLPFDYQKPSSDSALVTIPFQKNSTALTDSSLALLKAAILPWQGKAGITLLVNGYTDNSGTPIINEQLSFTRARAVSVALGELGFLPEAIQAQGWGEAAPAAGNDTEENRNKNRRVEVIVRY